MATITPSVENGVDGDPSIVRVTWTNMANGDDGSPVRMSQWADRSIQVFGTFGAGGSARWEGTNTDAATNFAALTDPQGNSLDFTTAKIEQVTEAVTQARPRVTAGDGTTSLTVVMLARRAQPMRV